MKNVAQNSDQAVICCLTPVKTWAAGVHHGFSGSSPAITRWPEIGSVSNALLRSSRPHRRTAPTFHSHLKTAASNETAARTTIIYSSQAL